MKFSKAWESYKKTDPEAQLFLQTFSVPVEDKDPIEIIGERFFLMSSLGETIDRESAEWRAFQLMVNLPQLTDRQIKENLFESIIDNIEIWNAHIEGDQIIYSDKKNDCFVPKGKYRALNGWMDILSSYLYTIDGFYKPIFFSDHFDWIQRNCEMLEIPIPEVPRTNDYRKYSMYYIELCKAFDDYQHLNNLSDAEFLCYLYKFADLYVDNDESSELPRPTNVWLTGANPWDYDMLENGELKQSAWACNEMTQRGDIVVIYAVTPHSCFHSIWRANSGGCFNPFNYYHCRTTVKEGLNIPHLTHREFMADPILADFKIGHKNLQGVNGFELSASEYGSFLKKLESLNFDVSLLPQLVSINSNWKKPIIEGENPEKQVEEKYIKPLLHNILGYNIEDYTQQARHKSGRKEKSIPDFVFFQEGEHGLEHCPFIIEAKHDFKSTRQRRKDYEQGLSYAQTYHAKLMSIIDMNRVIVFKIDKNGCADYTKPAFEAQWEVIYGDQDIQNKLIKLIGREPVRNLL